MSEVYANVFTEQNFRVKGVIARVLFNGTLVRNEEPVSITLATQRGVTEFLKSNNPFYAVEVTDLVKGKKITKEFEKTIVLTRYEKPFNFIT
jgi:hypothetical protein